MNNQADTEHDITPDELIEIEERAAIMTEHLAGKYGDTVYKHLIATAVKAQREGRTHALVESVKNAG